MKKSIFILLPLIFVLCQCSSDSDGGGGGNGGIGGAGGNPKGGNNPNGQVNLQGSWSGTGQIIVNNNQTFQCNNVAFEFNQSTNQIEVVRGDYTCEQNINYNWNPMTVELSGNKVLFQSQEIGTINGSTINITEGNDRLTIEKVGVDALNIQEVKIENGNTFNVSAQLMKQ